MTYYLLYLITINVHVDRSENESMTPGCRRSTPFHIDLLYLYIDVNVVLLEGMYCFSPQTNVDVTPKGTCNFAVISLFGWRRWDKLRSHWHCGVFALNNVLIGERGKNPQHLNSGRSIPAAHGGWNDSRLGGASPGTVVFVAVIDLPHQCVVDSYNLHC